MNQVVQPIARNLKRLREERNLSISGVAERAGVAKSTVSNLERGIGNPSIDTLWLLARVLSVPFAELFEENGEDLDVLRFEDAPAMTGSDRDWRRIGGRGDGFELRTLIRFRARGEIEGYVLDLAPGARRSAKPHPAGMVEHVFVVSGQVDIGVEGESAVLGAGDRIRFAADRPHHYQALDGPARLFLIGSYP